MRFGKAKPTLGIFLLFLKPVDRPATQRPRTARAVPALKLPLTALLLQMLFMTDEQLTQMRTLASAHTTDSSWNSCSTKAITATIGHFGHPVNCAVASPDGQFLAVVGDVPRVWIVTAQQGFETVPGNSKTLHFKAKAPMRSRGEHPWQSVNPGRLDCFVNRATFVAE